MVAISKGALVVALLTVVGAGWAGTKEAKMDEARVGATAREYVGRFSIQVPAGARRFGEEFVMRDLVLREVALTPPGEAGWRAAWASKRAEILALKAKRLRPDESAGEIRSDVVLEPGRLALVVYHHSESDTMVTTSALYRAEQAGLWLSCVSGLSFAETARARVPAVAHAYAPAGLGAPRPARDAFHLPRGWVELPFEEQESASATFRGGPLDVEITLGTKSTDEPKSGGLMGRFGDAVSKAGGAFAAGLSPVRNRGRTVAGMGGEEFVMRDAEEKKLYFMWEFKGEASSGRRPRIQLQMSAREAHNMEALLASWDRLVDSLTGQP